VIINLSLRHSSERWTIVIDPTLPLANQPLQSGPIRLRLLFGEPI
jgi:hypothetical protein